MTRRTLALLAVIVALVGIAVALQVVVFFAYGNMFTANSPQPGELPPPAASASCPRIRPAEYSAAPTPVARWSGEIGVGATSMPILADGSLYVTAHADMYSLDPNTGDVQWHQELPGAVSSQMVVVDGVAYVSAEYWDQHTSETGVVLALDADLGDLVWRYDIPGELWATPTVAGGLLYVGSFNGGMYALDADTGALRWQYRAGDTIRWDALVNQGIVYFASTDGHLYALDATSGELLWRYRTEGAVWVGPVISEGVAYQGPGDHHFYSLDAASGELLWRHTRDDTRWSRPVVIGGVVFATANEDRPPQTPGDPSLRSLLFHADVVALDARTGAVRWEFQTIGDASAPVVADGVVYVSTDDGRPYLLEDPPESGNPAMRGRVYALDAATGELIWQRRVVAEVGAGLQGLSVVDGVAYVESSDHFRYNDPKNPPALPICGQLTAFDAVTGETKWVFETDDQFSEPPSVQDGVAYAVTVNGQVHALRTHAGD